MQKKDICVVVEDYPPVIVKGAEAPMVYFGVSNHDENEEDLHATYG